MPFETVALLSFTVDPTGIVYQLDESGPGACSASLSDFRGPPYCLSEKYLVKVVPARLKQSRHPSKAVVS